MSNRRNRRERAAMRATPPTNDILGYYMPPGGGSVTALKTMGGNSWGAASAYGDATAGNFRESEADYALIYSTVDWVYRCIEVVSTKVGELLNQAKIQDRKTGKPVDDHLYYQALERSFRFFRHDIYLEWIRARLVFGESYIEKVNNYLEEPFALRWLNPLAVEPLITGGRIRHFQYMGMDSRMVQFLPPEITYDYNRNYFDDLRGLSPMRRALQAVNLDVSYQKAHHSFFKNGAQPGLIITLQDDKTVTDVDWNKFRTNLKEDLTGARNAYKTLSMRIPVNVTTVDLPKPHDSAELSADQKERIAAVFGVPVGMVTFGDSKYQLSPEQRKSFYEETVIPTCNAILKIVNADTLRFFDPYDRVNVVLDKTSIEPILEDQGAKYGRIQSDYQAGSITFNQMQQRMNMPTVEGGDFYLFPKDKVIVPSAQLTQASALIDDANTPAPTYQSYPQGQENTQDSTPIGGTPVIEAKASEPHTHKAIITAKHATPEEELAAWYKAWKQNGVKKALRFESYRLRDDVQTALRGAIDAGDIEATKAAFAQARETIAVKAISETKEAFSDAFNNVLDGARDADYRRNQAQRQLYRTIQRYGTQAYLNGLADGGVDTEDGELDSADKRTINRLLNEQAAYVGDLMKRVYSDDGVSDELAAQKAEQWFARSIMPFHTAGLAASGSNPMMEFGGKDGVESCDDCPRLKGQRHRLETWIEKGYVPPYGANLGCADGGHCLHTLFQVAGRERGGW